MPKPREGQREGEGVAETGGDRDLESADPRRTGCESTGLGVGRSLGPRSDGKREGRERSRVSPTGKTVKAQDWGKRG